jgi:tRNA pseudouridine13 synthase
MNKSLDLNCGLNSYLYNFSEEIPFHLKKNIPENFIVKEILPNNLEITGNTDLGDPENGLFYHSILIKRLIDTPGAIKLISKSLKIPNDWIGYAGLKDAHGITYQRISIFNTKLMSIQNVKFNNFSLEQTTRKKFEVNLGDLWGNRFYITMNNVNDSELHKNQILQITDLLDNIRKNGFPNFYGLQRFGSSRPVSHIVGKFLLKNDYENAIKSYLTFTSDFENENIRNLRKKLTFDWDLKFFLENIPKNYYYEILLAKSLLRDPNNYFKAFSTLQSRIKKLFINSYQSFIFNEMLSKILENYHESGELISELPLLNGSSDFSDLPEFLIKHVEHILKVDEISSKDFVTSKALKISTKQQFRKTLIFLKDFQFQYYNKNLLLIFSLPKSSYATMLIREIERKNELF